MPLSFFYISEIHNQSIFVFRIIQFFFLLNYFRLLGA